MKQINIVKGYQAMEPLGLNTHLSPAEQWALYKLRKLLKPHVEFHEEREIAIQEKYKDQIDDKGMLYNEAAVEFKNDIDNLNNMEKEITFEKPKIKMAEGIGFKTIEDLEEFIEFIPAE